MPYSLAGCLRLIYQRFKHIIAHRWAQPLTGLERDGQGTYPLSRSGISPGPGWECITIEQEGCGIIYSFIIEYYNEFAFFEVANYTHKKTY